MRLQLPLVYATLWELGDFFVAPGFCDLVSKRFIDIVNRKMKPDDFAWWITWYHDHKGSEWDAGFGAVIAATALNKMDFMCGKELNRAIAQCPALGDAILRTHLGELDHAPGDGTTAMSKFFNEQRPKKAGVFARYERQLTGNLNV
jgi:hypothetical protein